MLAGSASQDIFYVSGSNLFIDLEYFKALGVNIVEPSAKALKASGGWFENLSSGERRQVSGGHHHHGRPQRDHPRPADITEATWKKLPAVKAGQVVARSPEPSRSLSDRQVHPAPRQPRRGDREGQEGRLTPLT